MILSNGDTAEVLFKLRCLEKGLTPCTPYGLRRYDFVIDNGKSLIKVQVKMANSAQKDSFYQFNIGPNGKRYTDEQVDVFAFYIAPTNTWYIMPHHILPPTTLMRIPVLTPNRYTSFEEAWYILSNWDLTYSKFSGKMKNDEPPALPMSPDL
jgi:hypothetical protein